MERAVRRVRIRPMTYRGKEGFSVDGTEKHAGGPRHALCNIFVRQRASAEQIKRAYMMFQDKAVDFLILDDAEQWRAARLRAGRKR